ncbi:MAG: cysteine desulfurase family protein [Thermoplasmatota archaeon]
MNKETVYLDNSSSTRMDERVLEVMKPYLFEKYAVASSDFGYSLGIEAKEGLQDARKTIAKSIGGKPEELIFTSCGTESSNLALKGVARKLPKDKNHIITTTIEDFPVLKSAQHLEKDDFDVTYLEVNEKGVLDIEKLKESINEKTGLVSIQHGNQEIGTVQNIKEIGKVCDNNDVLFHTDATHTFTRLPIDVKDHNIDLMTLSAHTIHGPKGIGALYVKDGTEIEKLMDGGFQEFDKRAGVENIAGAVGFAKAVELVTEEENDDLRKMRDTLVDRILDEISDTTLNGPSKKRTPQNANITFHYVEGESITLHMDMRGFSVSTGSACFSKSLEASHVIMGIGGDHERAHGSVRFSFGRYNTMDDVDRTVEAIKEVVERLREISPLGKDK